MLTPIKLDLKALFAIQEEFALLNFKKSEFLCKIFSFLSESVALNLAFLGSTGFASEEKTTAVRMLAVDSISPIVVATRIGLWGAIPESLAVLRGALEGFAMLDLVVSHRKYKTAILEMNRKFDQVEFKAAMRSTGKDAEKLWGRMASLAHASAKRVRCAEYSHEGEKYDRIGCAVDPEEATVIAYLAACFSMRITESLRKAAEQEGLVFPPADEYKKMTACFTALLKDFRKSILINDKNDEWVRNGHGEHGD